MERLTAEQFAALATLLRLRAGPVREAARMVLVDGLTQAEAARHAGTLPQHANRAVKACRRGLALAQVAAGYTSTISINGG